MIGVVSCECFIYESGSLKEKRAVLKSIITRLKQTFNISVAEMDHQNVWQRTALTIVTVANTKEHAERELNRALNMIDAVPEMERTITEFEWL